MMVLKMSLLSNMAILGIHARILGGVFHPKNQPEWMDLSRHWVEPLLEIHPKELTRREMDTVASSPLLFGGSI